MEIFDEMKRYRTSKNPDDNAQFNAPLANLRDPNELVTFKELLLANFIKIDTVVQLLIEKGYFTEQKFYSEMKLVQAQYQEKCHD